MPELAKRCIKSREKYLPDYELCLRDENTFDIKSNKFSKQAYEAKKWAFVSDYIRMRVLYTYGGIYMDTDVEVLKNLDKFLNCKGFSGFEDKDIIPTGIIASEKGNKFIGEVLEWYKDRDFNPDKLVPNTAIITDLAKKNFGFKGGSGKELVKLKDDIFEFYPKNYFCPISHEDIKPNYKKLLKDENCYTIHRFAGSWLGKSELRKHIENLLLWVLKKIHLYNFVKKIYYKLYR